MHMQSGSCDCGLFAIAYITELAHGNDPRHVVLTLVKKWHLMYQEKYIVYTGLPTCDVYFLERI